MSPIHSEFFIIYMVSSEEIALICHAIQISVCKICKSVTVVIVMMM